MTLLLPDAASLCPTESRPALTCPVISVEHFRENHKAERGTYTHTHQGGGGIWTMTGLMRHLINMH